MGSTQGVKASSSPATRKAPVTLSRLPEASARAIALSSSGAGVAGAGLAV